MFSAELEKKEFLEVRRSIKKSHKDLYKILGKQALVAIERLMGMLLVAISVQMFMDGMRAYLNSPA